MKFLANLFQLFRRLKGDRKSEFQQSFFKDRLYSVVSWLFDDQEH